MGLTVGGLATGIDTNTLISKLMEIERQPLDRLETKKTNETSRLDAIKAFDSKLDALLSKVEGLSSSRTLVSRTASTSSSDYLKATAGSSATPGTYEVKVGRLAQVEKTVYAGVADRDTTSFGTGTLTISNDALGAPVEITIGSGQDTLQGIRDAINAQKDATGVSASIVNDGSGTPYRLVLTGASVENANIVLDTSGLSGGTAFPTVDAAVSRPASQALVLVDGIEIVSNTNTLTEAIPGVTLNLVSADPSFDPLAPDWSAVAVTNVEVATDTEGVKEKITDFVSAFNDLVKAAGNDNLQGDASIRAILSTLRTKFTDSASGTGLFQLGIATQKDGTLKVDTAKLESAIEDDLAGVETLLAGTATSDGIADLLDVPLTSFTNSLTGLLATRQKFYDSTIKRLDNEIARTQSRLDAREARLVAQFSNLEKLVSALNSQGNYLTQQVAALNGGNS